MAHKNPQTTILEYRRRRGRTAPIVFAGLSVILLVSAVALAIAWYTGGGRVAFLPTVTPSPTVTATPVPATATPAPSATPSPTVTPTETPPGEYIVQQGDTLIGIAERFKVDLLVLMSVNNIPDPTQLSVGQVLKIPEPGVALPTATPLPADLRRGSKIQHVIVYGETLQSIASLYNSTVEAIIKENELTDPNKIQVGQTLIVPVNIVTPTPTVLTPTANPSQPTATRNP